MAKQKVLKIEDFNILEENVLVKGIVVEERGGVYKPAQYDDKPELGLVIKVGTGRVLESGDSLPMKIQVGDTVYFNKYSSVKINLDGSDYFVIKEHDIAAYIR